MPDNANKTRAYSHSFQKRFAQTRARNYTFFSDSRHVRKRRPLSIFIGLGEPTSSDTLKARVNSQDTTRDPNKESRKIVARTSRT